MFASSSSPSKSLEDRTVVPNNPEANEHFCSNVVITSKYTLYDFLPLFLLEQFSRFANFYFLIVCVLQSIRDISITNGLPATALPLVVVLAFDGIVTANEDIKRHRDDFKANTSKTLVLRDGKFQSIVWADIRVGDILKVQRNEAVPSDCVFLASQSADNNTPDSCYVQTAQLDGETNLKLKQTLPATPAIFNSDDACAKFNGSIVCEAPNANFDRFVGMLHLGSGGRPLALEPEQILLRGCILRNVDSAYGIVVYTGRETKVRVRQTTRSRKVAQVEQMLNKLIAILVATLVAACILGAALAENWSNRFAESSWYLRESLSGEIKPSNSALIRGDQTVKQFFTYFLLNASIIPVSLYVSVRIARTLQMVVMEWDAEMFHEEPALIKSSGGLEGEYPFKVRSMDLNDELGQISHIFSDKTGTLTLNYMEFRKLLIRGVSYGLGTTQIGIDRMRREGLDVTEFIRKLEADELKRKEAGEGGRIPHVNFEDGSESHPGRTMASDSVDVSTGTHGESVFRFLLHLTLNHNVLRETVRDNNGAIIGSRLSASSPDEEAFLFASDSFGLAFISRAHELALLRYQPKSTSTSLPLTKASKPIDAAIRAASDDVIKKTMPSVGAGTGGIILPVRILNVLSYTQERKRMSVIVQLPVLDTDGTPVLSPTSKNPGEPQGEIILFCKGADSVVFERLTSIKKGSLTEEHDIRTRSQRQIAEWGNDGLRTLCFAEKNVSRAEYEEWSSRFLAANSDMNEVRKKKLKEPNKIDDLQTEIERDLEIQGASANEDKLQPEVPETIAQLAKAGIKIWMVTGDKQETAVNIGFATKLLDDTMRQIVATAESSGGPEAAMKRLRIAAKRMRAERLADLAEMADKGTPYEKAMEWVSKGVVKIEESFGVLAEPGHHTDIDIDKAENEMAEEFDETGRAKPLLTRLASRAGKSFYGAPPVSPHKAKEAEEGDEEEAFHGVRIATGDDFVAETPNKHVATTDVVTVNNSLMKQSVRTLAAKAMAPMLQRQRQPFALIIDEHALDAALAIPRMRAYLLYVAVNCSAVIACRARPDQKASVVRLIRHGVATSRTLAIGDGANDVDMIGTAHVGVGISGAEGVQAANASDYAIGRFRFLRRLLLVHGRWNYTRMSKLVLYMFWKNIFFVMTQFAFQFVNGFTGQKWYIEFGNQTFNLIYTSIPILILAILDRDVDDSLALQYPKLYEFSRLGRGLNIRVFFMWYGDAFLLSALNTIFSLYIFDRPDSAFVSMNGSSPYIFLTGTLAFTNVVVVCGLRIAAEMNRHYSIFQFIVFLSVILWIPAVFIFDALAASYSNSFDYMYGGARQIFTSASFWLGVLLFAGLCGVKMIAWKAWRRFEWPEFRHIVQEASVYTKEFSSIKRYHETADFARRTGKSIAEVLEEEIVAATVANSISAPSAAKAASARLVDVNVVAPLSPSTMDRSHEILEQVYAIKPLPMQDDGKLKYDPSNDFDKETTEEADIISSASKLPPPQTHTKLKNIPSFSASENDSDE